MLWTRMKLFNYLIVAFVSINILMSFGLMYDKIFFFLKVGLKSNNDTPYSATADPLGLKCVNGTL